MKKAEYEELQQLRAWKAEQMEVLAQLQLEECAKYLPVQLGDSIPAAILPALKAAAEEETEEDREERQKYIAAYEAEIARSGPAVSFQRFEIPPVNSPIPTTAAYAAIKAAKRPQTSNIQIKMVVNGDLVTFDGSWLKEL